MEDSTMILMLATITVEILGIVAAVHAVFYARTPQGAIAWALVLILFPWASLIPFAVFGRNRFHGLVHG